MAAPNRAALLKALQSRNREKRSGATVWGDLIASIQQGKAIPIVGDSVRMDRIFAFDPSQKTPPPCEDLLALTWAEQIGYPLPQAGKLAPIAQYNLVKRNGQREQAKRDFLTFLKETYLYLAQELDEEAKEIVEEEALDRQIHDRTFSEIVEELGHPYYNEDEDPLRLLGRLPLPIYVTTSPYRFLEQALRSEKGANFPFRTQVCFWNGRPLQVEPEHEPDPNYRPTPEEPLIYYLFGHEAYPETLVLSEDDHLDYLVAVTGPPEQYDPIIPATLRNALARSTLSLLGYRLHSWDFRVLFRTLRHFQSSEDRRFRIAVQLEPEMEDEKQIRDDARSYLRDYFGIASYQVVWSDVDDFLQQLWQNWQRSRQV